MDRLLKLPERLGVIASYIEPGARVADIGTDHGFLPVYLAQRGLARGIIASDISARSLASAKRTAAKYGVTDKIEFITAPGLDGIDRSQIDTVLIAGVGGETIADILQAAPWLNPQKHRLILQPQSKTDKLCQQISKCGYAVLDAMLTQDRGRIYTAILAGSGDIPDGDPEMALYSLLVKKQDPLIGIFLDEMIDRARRASTGTDGPKRFEALRAFLQTYETPK